MSRWTLRTRLEELDGLDEREGIRRRGSGSREGRSGRAGSCAACSREVSASGEGARERSSSPTSCGTWAWGGQTFEVGGSEVAAEGSKGRGASGKRHCRQVGPVSQSASDAGGEDGDPCYSQRVEGVIPCVAELAKDGDLEHAQRLQKRESVLGVASVERRRSRPARLGAEDTALKRGDVDNQSVRSWNADRLDKVRRVAAIQSRAGRGEGSRKTTVRPSSRSR